MRGGPALMVGLFVIAAGCAPMPGTPSATTTATDVAATSAAAAEDPPPDVTVTGYLDADAIIEFDSDDDGTPELMYKMAEYTTSGGVTVQDWVDVEPADDGLNGRLWFVVENETDETIADATLEFEIPKSLIAEIDDDSFTVTDVRAGTVEITVTDPDPRFEVRVVDFAGGLRPSIQTQLDPELIALGAKELFGGAPPEDVAAYAAGRTIDTATFVMNMTSRDFAFLRKARECAALDERDLGGRQICSAEMVLEFPDKFSEQDCADIAAINPTSQFSLGGCKAAVANDPGSCTSAPAPGNCLRWVEKSATNRCAILAGYPGAQAECTAGIGPWLTGFCEGSDWSDTCCETLAGLGYQCDGGGPSTSSPPTSAGGTHPVDDWFSSSLSACEALGVVVPGRALEDHLAIGGDTPVYGSDYADSLYSQGVKCLFRDHDEWYYITEITVSCWPTEADAYFVWNGDYGGGSTNENYCGDDPGVSADWTVECVGTDHVTINEGCASVGDSSWCAASLRYRNANCSMSISHYTDQSTDPVAEAVGFEPAIDQYLDSLR